MDTLIEIQRWIYQSVTADLNSFAETRNWLSLLAVLPLGIVFGAIHALTPGHSKTVLAVYVAGSSSAMARGTLIAVLLAVTHVVSAVLIALFASSLVTRTLGDVGRAPVLEDLSRGLLLLIGIWMIARAIPSNTHQHREGPFVGVIAGLVPCPLTLFVMVLALSRGVPEAGLTFAVAMMAGIATTLVGVSLLTTFAQSKFSTFLGQHGVAIASTSRVLEGLAGVALIIIGLREILFQ